MPETALSLVMENLDMVANDYQGASLPPKTFVLPQPLRDYVGSDVDAMQWKSIGGEKGQPGVKEQKGLVYQTIEDLNAEGYSTLTYQNQQNVKGTALWKNNKWRLIFKRNLIVADLNDVQLRQSVLMAVAVWNGSNRELNGQKGLAGWMLLKFN